MDTAKKLIENDPSLSLNDIGSKASLKKRTVYNVVKKDLKLKSLRKVRAQHIDKRKKKLRRDFCAEMLSKLNAGDIPL